MKTKIQYIMLLAVTALLAGCQSEQDPFSASSDKGSFTLSLNTGALVVKTETRTTLNSTQAANYNITFYQNNIKQWSKKYSTLGAQDYVQSVGTSYSVSAESCTEAEAETGWGCPRYYGRSESFEIVASATPTPVSVTCEPMNGGLCVEFDKSFTDTYTRFSATTTDARALKFDDTNKAIFDSETGKRTGGSVAYYNILETDERDVELEVVARGAQVTKKTVTLRAGKVMHLTVYGPNAGGEDKGTINIEIEYDDQFDTEDHNVVID